MCQNRFLSPLGFQLNLKHLGLIYNVSNDYFFCNVKRYIDFVSCHGKYINTFFPKSIDDFSEITFDEIKKIIDKETEFKKKAKLFVQNYDAKKIKVEDAAVLLGVAPSNDTNTTQSFYPFLMDFDCECINKDNSFQLLKEKEKILVMLVGHLVDDMRDGFIAKNQLGKSIWLQGYARKLYRGENAYYPETRASLFRKGNWFNSFISLLKQKTFIDVLKQLEYIKQWNNYCDVDYKAIAQHYLFDTSYLDVSSDLSVSLFFACCSYDYDKKEWRPLNNSDFEKVDSRNDVFAHGGDSRFGILYCCHSSIIKILSTIDPYFPLIDPVGYFPFLRSEYQSAYTIQTYPDFDLKKFPIFQKLKFRLTEEICNWIFEKMDKGKKIFPNEFSKEFMDFVDKVRATKQFSTRIFENTYDECYKNENSISKESLRECLSKNGYQIIDGYEILSEKELKFMDSVLCERYIPKYIEKSKQSSFRGTFEIQSS